MFEGRLGAVSCEGIVPWEGVRWVGDIILPGDYGVGMVGFGATDSGYQDAADHLVQLDSQGCYVDTSDYEVQRVLNLFGASDINTLRTQRSAGWYPG